MGGVKSGLRDSDEEDGAVMVGCGGQTGALTQSGCIMPLYIKQPFSAPEYLYPSFTNILKTVIRDVLVPYQTLTVFNRSISVIGCSGDS